jgi:hypothetical protein
MQLLPTFLDVTIAKRPQQDRIALHPKPASHQNATSTVPVTSALENSWALSSSVTATTSNPPDGQLLGHIDMPFQCGEDRVELR